MIQRVEAVEHVDPETLRVAKFSFQKEKVDKPRQKSLLEFAFSYLDRGLITEQRGNS